VFGRRTENFRDIVFNGDLGYKMPHVLSAHRGDNRGFLARGEPIGLSSGRRLRSSYRLVVNDGFDQPGYSRRLKASVTVSLACSRRRL